MTPGAPGQGPAFWHGNPGSQATGRPSAAGKGAERMGKGVREREHADHQLRGTGRGRTGSMQTVSCAKRGGQEACKAPAAGRGNEGSGRMQIHDCTRKPAVSGASSAEPCHPAVAMQLKFPLTCELPQQAAPSRAQEKILASPRAPSIPSETHLAQPLLDLWLQMGHILHAHLQHRHGGL